MVKKICSNEMETKAFGAKFAQILQYGDFIALDGDLGAGKTFLSQVIIKNLGIDDYVTSPSYTIVNEYDNIYHFDVYRIDDLEEMYEIGYEEYFFSDGICLVEWASMVEELLPEQHYKIQIQHGDSFNERIITIKGTTSQLEQRLEQIK